MLVLSVLVGELKTANMRAKEIILPQLYEAKGDLSKDWFVYYSFYNPNKGKLERKKCYKGFKGLNTIAERREHGLKRCAYYQRKLKNGWTPLNNKAVIYRDEMTYHLDRIKNGMVKISQYNWEFYINEFLKDVKLTCRVSSYQTYLSKFRFFKLWLNLNNYQNMDVDYFTPDLAAKFFQHLNRKKKPSGSTHNAYRELLYRLCETLVNKEALKKNPFKHIVKRHEAKNPSKYFNENAIKQIKEVAQHNDPQLWFFELFMFYCFIRPKELRFLKIGDIDFSNKNICIPADVSKNKKKQNVVIPEPLYTEIVKHNLIGYPADYYIFSLKGKPDKTHVGKNYFYHHWRKVKDAIPELKNEVHYNFKHTGAITAKRSGIDLKDLQMQLRHHSLDQVNVYLRDMDVTDSIDLRTKFKAI